MADPEIDVVALTKTYFEVWNSHDEAALRGLHADASSLHDWDATHGPTNAAVAAGVAGIWKAEPTIKCEIIDLYTCGPDLTVVANINVVVNAEVTINVCDVIEFDASGRVTTRTETATSTNGPRRGVVGPRGSTTPPRAARRARASETHRRFSRSNTGAGGRISRQVVANINVRGQRRGDRAATRSTPIWPRARGSRGTTRGCCCPRSSKVDRASTASRRAARGGGRHRDGEGSSSYIRAKRASSWHLVVRPRASAARDVGTRSGKARRAGRAMVLCRRVNGLACTRVGQARRPLVAEVPRWLRGPHSNRIGG